MTKIVAWRKGLTRETVEAYLPRNYRVVGPTAAPYGGKVEAFLIEGADSAGWTADDYVIPRLGSGSIGAERL